MDLTLGTPYVKKIAHRGVLEGFVKDRDVSSYVTDVRGTSVGLLGKFSDVDVRTANRLPVTTSLSTVTTSLSTVTTSLSTGDLLVVTVERLVVTVERLVVTYGVRQPSGTADLLTYQVGPGVVLRNIPAGRVVEPPGHLGEQSRRFEKSPVPTPSASSRGASSR